LFTHIFPLVFCLHNGGAGHRRPNSNLDFMFGCSMLPLVIWCEAPDDQRVFSPRHHYLGCDSVRDNYLFKEHYTTIKLLSQNNRHKKYSVNN